MAGHPLNLSKAVSKLGFNVRIWQLEDNTFGYGENRAIFKSGNHFLSREMKRIKTLLQVAWWADVVHCTFGSTLAGNSNITLIENSSTKENIKIRFLKLYETVFFDLEIKLYKLMKKKLIVDYQGDDIRQRCFQLENYEHSIAHVVNDRYYTEEFDYQKVKRLNKYIKQDFKINALNPDLLHYLPPNSRFIPYSTVPINQNNSVKEFPKQKPLVFVHAPSNRQVKGSAEIIQIFSELIEEGHDVQLLLVEGMENSKALKLYGGAFIAIDQLNAGWYGGFAVECMAQGVPVISYIREMDLHFLPFEMREQIPIISACACTLKSQILKLIKLSNSEYIKLSESSIEYVKAWHDPDVIAAEVTKIYT